MERIERWILSVAGAALLAGWVAAVQAPVPAHADPADAYSRTVSSYSAVAMSSVLIPTTTINLGDMLHSITISSPGVYGSRFQFFDSRASTPTSIVAIIDGTRAGTYFYDHMISSGAAYTQTGSTPPDVTMTFFRRGDR